MNVDFNNLRKQTAYSLDRVIKLLNDGVLPEEDYSTHYQKDGSFKTWKGNVLVDKDELKRHIDQLRSNVWTMLCVYDEENPDFQLCYEEVENSGGLARFNEGEDD